jgi:hypothetical protein
VDILIGVSDRVPIYYEYESVRISEKVDRNEY